MFPGKEKFEFGYDPLRHSSFCMVLYMRLKSRLPRSSNQVRNIKLEFSIAEARFRLKRLFYNKKRDKSKN